MTRLIDIILSATDQTRTAFASVSKGLDGLQARASSVSGKLSVLTGAMAAVTGAFAALEGIQALKILDQLDDLSEKTGITVEKLSELRFAGEAVGTPMEALTTGVNKLAKQMAEAAGGSKEASETFRALGIEVKNSDGTLRGIDEVLGDLADRFAGYEDGAAKAALAQRVFGKSGADMIPLLNQGRQGLADLRKEAEQLGAIYDSKTAKAAADFNDNLVKIKLSSEAAAVSIAGPFIESLSRLSEKFLEAKKNGGLFAAGWASYKAGVDEFWSGSMFGANQPKGKSTQEIQDWVNSRGKANGGGGRGFVNPKIAAPVIDQTEEKKERKVRSGGGATKDLEAAAKSYLEQLDKQLERTKELSEVEKALSEIQRIRADGGRVTDAMKQDILLKAANIDATKALAEEEKKREKEREEAQRRFFELQDEGRRLMEDLRTPVEAYNAELKKLNELYDAGAISAETYNRALAKSGKEFEEAQKRANEATGEMDQFAKNAAENIQDSLGQGIADILDGNYKSIGDSFSKMLNRMIAEAAAADLARRLFGDLAKGGEGEGLFGEGLKWFSGALNGNRGAASSSTGDALGSFISSKGLASTSASSASGSSALGSFGSWLSSLASFDVGTDYVPHDMVAKIHKGERIVTASENRRGGGDAGRPMVIYYQAQPGESRKTSTQNGRALADQLAGAQRSIS